jgi:ParB family chromosome partitioning protein
MATSSQLMLIPSAPPAAESLDLKLSDLESDSLLLGPDPSPELVRSVGRLGVLQPILVRRTARKLLVIEGRRRIKAARANNLDAIPALVVDVSLREQMAMTLVAHATRRSNVVVEYDAICYLAERGADESQISEATGLPVQTIRRRMALGRLNNDLLESFRAGKISASVAENAAKLPKKSQVKLLDILGTAGKITTQDVKEQRRVHREQAVSSLPFSQIEQPLPVDDWHDRAVKLLNSLSGKVSPKTWRDIRELIEERNPT